MHFMQRAPDTMSVQEYLKAARIIHEVSQVRTIKESAEETGETSIGEIVKPRRQKLHCGPAM